MSFPSIGHMPDGIVRLTTFLVVVSVTASFIAGSIAFVGQVVVAQNTTTNTTNMTDSEGNMTGRGALTSTERLELSKSYSGARPYCEVNTC